MKIVYIMRGLPGSGKSTFAKKLAGRDGAIHSTDDFFMEEDKYCFDAERLQECHFANQAAFRESLVAGIKTVICDNTNCQAWEYEPYIAMAEEFGYQIVFITMPLLDPEIAASRSKHSVPIEKIREMIERWAAI